jgi:hypothetical protein
VAIDERAGRPVGADAGHAHDDLGALLDGLGAAVLGLGAAVLGLGAAVLGLRAAALVEVGGGSRGRRALARSSSRYAAGSTPPAGRPIRHSPTTTAGPPNARAGRSGSMSPHSPHMRSLRTRALLALASAAGLMALPAQAAASPVGGLYRVTGATVSVRWANTFNATDDDLTPYTTTNDETAALTLSAPLLPSLDAQGIYTADLKGTLTGTYDVTSPDGNTACSYTLNPGALQEELQLNVVPLSGHRLEVNAGLGLGTTTAAQQAFGQEFAATQTDCGGYGPTNFGWALSFTPAPNNVHTPQCAGIADGCEIVPASRFRSRAVTVAIEGFWPVPVSKAGDPPGATGQASDTYSINVTLTKA